MGSRAAHVAAPNENAVSSPLRRIRSLLRVARDRDLNCTPWSRLSWADEWFPNGVQKLILDSSQSALLRLFFLTLEGSLGSWLFFFWGGGVVSSSMANDVLLQLDTSRVSIPIAIILFLMLCLFNSRRGAAGCSGQIA